MIYYEVKLQTQKAGMNISKTYKRLAKSMAQLVSLAKMYKLEHPIVKDKMANTYKELANFFADNKQPIVLAKSADMLLLNGEKIEPEDKLMMRFIEDFIAMEIGSIEIDPSVSREEFTVFIRVMCRMEHVAGADNIKKFFSDNKISHVIARAATFKLVQENEDVVRKGEFVRFDTLPQGVLEKFSNDFMKGAVSEKLKTAGKDYKRAAHNSSIIAGLTSDLMKTKDTPEDLEKILWLLADYLIDEIGTSKEEETNRKVLEEIKKKLLSSWADKPEKKHMVQSAEKTYAVINTALQIKGLISLYKRHKKELESAARRIKKILSELPPESQLYKKSIDELIGLGSVFIDEKTFK